MASLHILLIWYPEYWQAGYFKAVTAGATVPTAALLFYLLPRVAQLPSARRLEAEVQARLAAEEALCVERDRLEARIAERTAELEAAHAAEEEARHRAESASLAKDKFLASVSHELRTPLQAILGWSQVLASSGGASPDTLHAIERLQANVQQQARLINDLLDISRILSGKLIMNTEVVDAKQVLDHAIDGVRHVAAQKGVRIDLQAEVGCHFETDSGRLQQVVTNLLSNAINASDMGGRVQVRSHSARQQLTIEVQDWGQGIEPAEAEQLFEPFRQGRRRDGRTGGMGLGLAISRNIVHLLHGFIRAESAGPGKGSTFTILLPLSAPATPSSRGPERVSIPGPLRHKPRGKRMLYVEDDLDILQSHASMLRTLGVEVARASTYEEGERLLKTETFDVLVSDLQLGGEQTGYDLVRQARSAGLDMVAIAVSAYGRREDVEASHTAGFTEHLTKPVDVFALGRRIAELLP